MFVHTVITSKSYYYIAQLYEINQSQEVFLLLFPTAYYNN